MSLLSKLALQQFRRQLRTTEWRALLLSAWIAISLTTLLVLLGDRLERGLLRESAGILGADLVLSSSRPIPDEQITAAKNAGLQTTTVKQFPSMVSTEYDESEFESTPDAPMMLVSVRVPEAPYPLRGNIHTDPVNQAGTIPPPGEVWAEPRVLEQLGLKRGDKLSLGYVNLKISARLLAAPDRGTGLRSFSPHIIINPSDLAASQVLTPGSRVSYRLLMAGTQEQVALVSARLSDHLESYERLMSLQQNQPVTGNALGDALAYLKLSALTALLISALTIILSLRRFAMKQHLRAALLLNLGLQRTQLIRVYLYQLLLAWGLLAVAGTLTGVAVETALQGWLHTLIPQQLPTPAAYLYGSGALVGLALLLLIGLPPILSLANVPVAALLRGTDSVKTSRPAWLLQGGCLLLLAIVILVYLQAPIAALLVLALLVIGGALFGFIAQALLALLVRPLARCSVLGRLLQIRLKQQKRWHRLQSAIIVLLLALLSVVWISRSDLLTQWRAQFPADTPNYFVINIQPWQKQPLDQFIADHQINADLYPMIRGRLTTLNGKPIKPQLSAEAQQYNALNRELNLSWRQQRPPHNPLSSGQWWSPTSTAPEISVEQKMAQTLGLKLGDELGFDIGGQFVSAKLTSTRKVEWNSFRPNFFVIFSPGALENYPTTWITSFRLDEAQKPLATQLLREFPSLTLIDIDQILTQLGGWLERLGQSSAMILLITLLCGVILLAVTLLQALEQRRYESALLQTLGATPQQARSLDLLEFLLLGIVCGLLAAASAEAVLAGIQNQLLHTPLQWHLELWLGLPLSSALLFCAIGFLIRRPLRLAQCYRILRSN